MTPCEARPGASNDEVLAASRHKLVDQIWIGAGGLALMQLPLIAWRASDVGLHGQLIVHLVLSVLALAICLARHRIPQAVKSALLVVGALAVGFTGLLSMGMASGAGYFWVILGVGLASVLYSLRLGLSIAVGSAALQLLAGLGFVNGHLEVPFDLHVHAVSASGWVNFFVVTTFVSLVMLLAIGGFQRAMLGLLARIQAQRDELVVQRDQLDKQREQLMVLATHDRLTGLPAMQLGIDRLDVAISAARRASHKVSLLFVDLDGFKAVNDSRGHEFGDLVLQQVAQRLRTEVRASDTVARAGGDEFVVVLGGLSDTRQAMAVARKIVDTISRPVDVAGLQVTIGASVGVATFPDHAEDGVGLRRAADTAMYQAKRLGKSRVHCAGTQPASDGQDGAPG